MQADAAAGFSDAHGPSLKKELGVRDLTFMGIAAVITIVPIVYSYLEFKKIKNQ